VRALILVLSFVLAACAHEQAERPALTPVPTIAAPSVVKAASAPSEAHPDEIGLASWYGSQFAGRKTANGERFDPGAMTAAHRELPFGTWVEVRRPDTGQSVRVRVNDRGPWGDPRCVIDLSRAAAKKLQMLGAGKMRVELRVVHGPF
jgi:rare lipoprotein A